MIALVTFVAQIVLAVALPYFVLSMVFGIRVARRGGRALWNQEQVSGEELAATSTPYHVYCLVPCLNEGRVIATTVTSLVREPSVTVLVIDDASDDDTAAQALQAASAAGAADRVLLVPRHLPDARTGKGPALNAAHAVLLEDVTRRELDPRNVIVAVMDADGRLSPNAVRACLPLFDDPKVGGVQLTVRIRDRRRLIAQFQDVEFWMISALSQFARSLSGTVSLGGNGQFTRLSALLGLEGDPWSDSLTEDLDLGLRLLADGWKVTTTPFAYVDQQGVDSYRRLLRQRTRWYQGHMTCGRRLPELWRAHSGLHEVALLEVTSYLLVPWLIVLPWSILQQWVLYQLLLGSSEGIIASGLSTSTWQVGYAFVWYLISFLPNLLIGLAYWRRTRSISLPRALLLGHLMIAWNYIGYLATWRALGRMVTGRSGWVKTSRSVEADGAEVLLPTFGGSAVPSPRPAVPLGAVAGGLVIIGATLLVRKGERAGRSTGGLRQAPARLAIGRAA